MSNVISHCIKIKWHLRNVILLNCWKPEEKLSQDPPLAPPQPCSFCCPSVSRSPGLDILFHMTRVSRHTRVRPLSHLTTPPLVDTLGGEFIHLYICQSNRQLYPNILYKVDILFRTVSANQISVKYLWERNVLSRGTKPLLVAVWAGPQSPWVVLVEDGSGWWLEKIGWTLLWSGYFVITIDLASPHLACRGVGLLYNVKQWQIKLHFLRIICYRNDRIEVPELFYSFLVLSCYTFLHINIHACAFPNFDCDVLTFFAFLLTSSGQGIMPRLGRGSAVRERWRRQIRDLCCIQHIS